MIITIHGHIGELRLAPAIARRIHVRSLILQIRGNPVVVARSRMIQIVHSKAPGYQAIAEAFFSHS